MSRHIQTPTLCADEWRTAEALLELYNEAAEAIAITRAIAMIRVGDGAGYDAWRKIADVVMDLRKLRACETMH